MKITHQLAVAGYLETVRGKGGGMRLAVPPKQVNLGAVVRRVEPDFALVECFAASNGCVLTGYCRLAGIFAGALDGFLGHLDRYSLADLVPDAQSRVSPTVGVPLPWPRERPAQQGRRAAAASGRNDQRLRRF
jgi:Rrf2 family nitric oxide-sensitive transcriptional repressor